jgi:phage protein D/phage baseplate assembly protein gpV
MSRDTIVASQITIKVDGAEIQRRVLDSVLEVMVDQNTQLPWMFTLRINDPNLTIIDEGPFDLTKEVEIEAQNEDRIRFKLIKGEITSLEPRYNEGMTVELLVRGYDKSHRLYREKKSKSFLNIKDSDLASQIAGNAGLSAEVDTTSTVYEHLYQHNQSDLEFLMERAWRIGYECFVDEGKLYFRKPPSPSGAVEVAYGEDLLSFFPVASLAEQVDEVLVKGWDSEKLEAIVGQSNKGKLYPKIGESKDGAAWASSFGTGKKIFVDQPVVSQAEANMIAEARLNELSGAFIEAQGRAFRRPEIKSGKPVKLTGLGNRFSGTYMVTSAVHVYVAGGLTTDFTVRGTRTGLLTEQMAHHPPIERWPGIVPAIITNTDDPNDQGRVKVKYPWMTDDAESFWARLIGPGAGPEAGLFMVPEVGDEVVVAFEHGDFNHPYVIGGVWNGKHAIPSSGASGSSGERPLVRTWTSRTGHEIAMFDNADKKIQIKTTDGHNVLMDDANKKVEIKTSGGHKVTLDDQGKKMEIATSGGQKISMDDNARSVKVESGMTIEIKAATQMKLEAATIDIQASGPVNIKGAMVNLG